MDKTITKEKVVRLWTIRGIAEFYIGFDIWDRFAWYSAFFWHQGLEKFCKVYLLGTKSLQSENLREHQARKTIDEIVRREMGHHLIEMIDKLIAINVLDEEIKTEVHHYFGKDFTGKELIEILEKAYEECRYPLTPVPIEPVYFTPEKISWRHPLSSRELMDFAFKTGLKILKRIEQDFNFITPRDNFLITKDGERVKFLTFVKDKDWMRFRRVFFRENI